MVGRALDERSELAAWRTLWDGADVLLSVLYDHPDGGLRVEAMNPASTRLLGVDAGTYDGDTPEGVAATLRPAADAFTAFLAGARECLATGARVDREIALTMPAGARQFVLTMLPLRDGPAPPRRVLTIALDVTATRALEAAHARDRGHLATSEARLAAVLEATNQAVWLVDAQWQTVYTNPALTRMLGYTAAELRGMRPTDLVPPDDVPDVQADYRRREAGAEQIAESTLVAKDGRLVHTLAASAPVRTPDGAFGGAVAMLTDITERRRDAEAARAREAERIEAQRLEALGLMAGGIAHDFNNLLTGVLASAELARDLVADPQARALLDTIELAAQRAAVLARQMLAFSGGSRLESVPVDLGELLASTRALLRASVDHRHALELDVAAGAPPVLGDAGQLGQVVMNLVINASEAIGDRAGAVRVELGSVDVDPAGLATDVRAPELAAGPHARLRVSDDGPGMPAEVRRRIFDPFFSTKGTGRGLGLAAVLGIVRAHRGAIVVAPRPGGGTMFDVLLPATDQPVPARRAARPAGEPRRARGDGEVVLVVDDERLLRVTARRTLERLGYQVVEAISGEEALARLAAAAPPIDVVLLDLTMPGLDGARTVFEMQARGLRAPVLLMSGYAEQDVAERLEGARIAGYLAKPFTPAQLAAMLREILEAAP